MKTSKKHKNSASTNIMLQLGIYQIWKLQIMLNPGLERKCLVLEAIILGKYESTFVVLTCTCVHGTERRTGWVLHWVLWQFLCMFVGDAHPERIMPSWNHHLGFLHTNTLYSVARLKVDFSRYKFISRWVCLGASSLQSLLFDLTGFKPNISVWLGSLRMHCTLHNVLLKHDWNFTY